MAANKVVNPFSQAELGQAVRAIYANGGKLASTILSAKQVDFKPSKAAHMYALVASTIWGVRAEIVAQTFVAKHLWDGTPVTDFPKVGTHAYEFAWEDKDDAERSESIASLMLEQDLLERLAEHYGDIARDEADEAGRRAQDGGRTNHLRTDGTKVNGEQFSYVESFEDWLTARIADTSAKRRPRFLAQLELVATGIYKRNHPDLQNALAYAETLVSSERLDVLAAKRWIKLLENAIKFDAAFIVWSHYKALPDNEDAREDFRFATWAWGKAQERFMADWDLVLHTGVPEWLVSSVFWRTEAAKLKATEAEAKAAEALAKAAEVAALGALEQAEFACEEAQESIEHQRDLMLEKRHQRELTRAKREAERAAELAALVGDEVPAVVAHIDACVAAPTSEVTKPVKAPKGINGARTMRTNNGAASASQLRR